MKRAALVLWIMAVALGIGLVIYATAEAIMLRAVFRDLLNF
jgi:hypothetical protein